jgi:hypothetical protein
MFVRLAGDEPLKAASVELQSLENRAETASTVTVTPAGAWRSRESLPAAIGSASRANGFVSQVWAAKASRSEYQLFCWDEVEDGAWEDPDFLKAFENQGQKVSLKEADSQTVDIVVIETKGSGLERSNALQGAPRGAYEIAQHGDVGAVSPDSPRVYRKSEAFSEIQVNTGVIQLRKTESLRGKHTIAPGRINRARRTVVPPRAAGHLVELLPIGFAPGRHTNS